MSNKDFDGVFCDKGVCGEADEDLKKVVLEEVKKADQVHHYQQGNENHREQRMGQRALPVQRRFSVPAQV